MPVDDLRRSPMMSHLLDALERGEDIGHYGRLTFAMVARHFMDTEELVRLLARGGDSDERKAQALVKQVEDHDYNPPRRVQRLQRAGSSRPGLRAHRGLSRAAGLRRSSHAGDVGGPYVAPCT